MRRGVLVAALSFFHSLVFLFFSAAVATTSAQTAAPPVLLSESTSTRAIALDSVTFVREPFPTQSPIAWAADRRTRIIIFALNLNLGPGEDFASVTAEAEDASRRKYPLAVEYVGPVTGQEWISALVLRLNDDLGSVGDVLMHISHHGASSNRVRVGIGRVGGGPPDDAGAIPTPLPPYAIGGQVKIGDSAAGGITVTLTDAENKVQATTTTDANGNYIFGNLTPGVSYVVTPLRTNYTFNPASQTIQNLTGYAAATFSGGLANYVINGSVIGARGPLDGVRVILSGSQNAVSFTDRNGHYGFSVPAEGNYQVRPDDQYLYAFTPANAELTNLSSNQSFNFNAAPQPVTGETNVLEFDGTQKSVDYGYFWHMTVEYSHFFWEFWAMPSFNAGATYMISDGYGGAHAILFGFNASSGEYGRYSLFGNTWDGTNVIFFGSDAGPAPNEWGHFAVGWDGAHVITYFNGVPVGKKAFAGPRYTPGYFGGGGRVLIGGSDHNNLVGRIAQVRGYEGWNPRGDSGAVGDRSAQASFAPDTVFRSGGNLLSRFFQPKSIADNFSPGYSPGTDGPGVLRGTINGILAECPNCPIPQYVIDPTAPDVKREAPGQPPVLIDAPPPTPTDAVIFDSFARANATYVFGGAGGLGSTENGAAGPQVWQSGVSSERPQPFGILNGVGVLLGNDTALAWVNTGISSGDADVRVDRRPGAAGSGHNTGLAFRVVDAANYFFAYSSGEDDPAPKTLTLGYYQAGKRTELAKDVAMPASWTTLRVVTKGAGDIGVYADATLIYSNASPIHAAASGAGLFNNGPGLGLTNRWDNFTVRRAN